METIQLVFRAQKMSQYGLELLNAYQIRHFPVLCDLRCLQMLYVVETVFESSIFRLASHQQAADNDSQCQSHIGPPHIM